ncbi:MAG: hypothetical protein VYD57_16810 [Pseudomonadota bacterium]|nr:hypothetical protein [Pseudomonadota bacterium]
MAKGEAGDETAAAEIKPKKRFGKLAIALAAVALLSTGGGASAYFLLDGEPSPGDHAADAGHPPESMHAAAAPEHPSTDGHGSDDGHSAKDGHGGSDIVPLPVATWETSSKLRPADYAIAMVFGDEAILIARDVAIRAKPGMVVPGLGTITAIREDGPGGIVEASEATLKTF